MHRDSLQPPSPYNSVSAMARCHQNRLEHWPHKKRKKQNDNQIKRQKWQNTFARTQNSIIFAVVVKVHKYYWIIWRLPNAKMFSIRAAVCACGWRNDHFSDVEMHKFDWIWDPTIFHCNFVLLPFCMMDEIIYSKFFVRFDILKLFCFYIDLRHNDN